MSTSTGAGSVIPGSGQGAAWVSEHGAHLLDYAAHHLPSGEVVPAVVSAVVACREEPAPRGVSDRGHLLAVLRADCLAVPGHRERYVPESGPGMPCDQVLERAWSLVDPLGTETLRLMYRHGLAADDVSHVLAIPAEDAVRLATRTQDMVEALVSGLDALANQRRPCPDLAPLVETIFPDEEDNRPTAGHGGARVNLLSHMVKCPVCARPINIRYTVPQMISNPRVAPLNAEGRRRLLDALSPRPAPCAPSPSPAGPPVTPTAPAVPAAAPPTPTETPVAAPATTQFPAPSAAPPTMPAASPASSAPSSVPPPPAPVADPAGAPTGHPRPVRPRQDRSTLPYQPVRPNRTAPPDQRKRPERADGPDRPAPRDIPGGSGGSGGPGRPDRAARPDRPGHRDRSTLPYGPALRDRATHPSLPALPAGPGPSPTGADDGPPRRDPPARSWTRADDVTATVPSLPAVPATVGSRPSPPGPRAEWADGVPEPSGTGVRVLEALAWAGEWVRSTTIKILIIVVAGAAGTFTGMNLLAPTVGGGTPAGSLQFSATQEGTPRETPALQGEVDERLRIPPVVTLDEFGQGSMLLAVTKGTLAWRISAPGLTVSPSSGTSAQGHTDVITLRAHRIRHWCGTPSSVTVPLTVHGPAGSATTTVRWQTC
ncbi:hypothetical protein GCM10017673_11040 [Streptosporangium violaceochromogenes]|nr:hypothetical protein GCM10017673_11040 [Streptosporangium violaceochromogenes]